jgi:hypothetical protein
MRRGLMAWDADEVPAGTLEERIQRLQSAMAASGQNAMLLYTNFIRSAAVSYLTAFSPYWADGVLLVPHQGEPLFATTLSKRVGNWIETVMPVGNLVHSPVPGKVVAEHLAAANVRRLAILELDDFPSGLYDDIAAMLPETEFVDGSETFARARGHLDPVERRLLARADAIARGSLDQLNVTADLNVGVAVGVVERYARAQGAEEVYVAIAPDLDAERRFIRLSGQRPLGRRFAIRASVAYKGAWIRRAKTYAREDADKLVIAGIDAWFNAMLANTHPRGTLAGQIAAALSALPRAELVFWLVEAVMGTRPLVVIASAQNPRRPLAYDAALVLTVGLNLDGLPWSGAGLIGGTLT